jgi:palmitoyltransferase
MLRMNRADQPPHREALSQNVGIWIWLTRIFALAIPTLAVRSVGPLSSLNDPDNAVTPHESTGLIIKNFTSLKEDLHVLNKLMHIARNMLVTPDPEVAQDICAAVSFDQMVYQTIILCVNVTSKGYDGEILDENSRSKLNEITELCELPLVLQPKRYGQLTII